MERDLEKSLPGIRERLGVFQNRFYVLANPTIFFNHNTPTRRMELELTKHLLAEKLTSRFYRLFGERYRVRIEREKEAVERSISEMEGEMRDISVEVGELVSGILGANVDKDVLKKWVDAILLRRLPLSYVLDLLSGKIIVRSNDDGRSSHPGCDCPMCNGRGDEGTLTEFFH